MAPLLAAALLLLPGPGAAAALALPAGVGERPVVRSVELRSDLQGAHHRELPRYLTIPVGEPLAEAAVRRTLNNLYASGLVSRAGVWAEPQGDGVRVVVAVWGNVLVDEVRIEGELGAVRREDLRAVLVQREGEALLESRVLRGDFQLEDYLEEQGYREASVGLAVELSGSGRRATVTYQVDPGPRWQVGELTFAGDLGPFTPEALARDLGIEPGQPARRDALRRSAERLERRLVEQKYRTAAVGPPQEIARGEERRVDLAYPVTVGPRIVFEVEGASIARLRKRGLLPFLTGEPYDEALLLQALERVRSHFQRQGHYQVQVGSRTETTEEGQRIVLEVDPGPVQALEEIRLVGNQDYSDEDLLRHMATRSSRFLGLGPGRLVSDVLDEDLASLRAFYAQNGYEGTVVGPPEVAAVGGALTLTIPVVEGTRRTVREVSFAGASSLDPDQVRREFTLTEGGPFALGLLNRALADLRAHYETEGFADAQVSAVLEWNETRTAVAVRVSVFEGPRQVLDRILVRGNRRTDRDIILRALGVRAGDPVSRSRLLAMERNLYQLGVFSRVQVSLTPADLASTRRDVVVHVEEGRTRSLAYGVGYELDPDSREEGREQGPRGFVGYSQRNLFGRAHHFLMDLRVEEEETRFRALLDQPYLAAVPVGLRYELFRFEEDRESFSALRWIGRVEAHDEWRHGRFSLSIDHRYLELSDFPADLLVEQEVDGVVRRVVRPGILSPLETPDPLAEDPLKPDLQVASVIPGFSWDQRDDPVDPQRGWTLSSQLQVAFPLGRAEARFADLFLQHTRYLPLGERGILAGSLRLQAIEPLRSVGGTEGDNLLAIPLDERIYSGGRSTHRAFDRLELGIPGETLFGAPPRALPIGGTGLALLNLEYRLRLLGPVGGTVFFDWGQVFRDWRDFDASLLRPGAGLGVTYYSPIGPLRVDVGFNIDREPGEPSYRVNFNFGHPF